MDNKQLIEALELIWGDREKTHGNPARNLQAIAEMWNAYISIKLDKAARDECEWHLSGADVCAMMNCVKIARFANDPTHPDNPIDGIGYWALVERIKNDDS